MRKILFMLPILLAAESVSGQKPVTLDGYLNDMQSVYHMDQVGWLWENQVHNRLNLHFYPASWLHGSVQVRNRLIFGNTVSKLPGYAEFSATDPGWIPLSLKHDSIFSDKGGYIASTMIDRAFLEFTAGDFVATIGRQRINWGQTFVWNPNDIFNTYSYFEVDYAERPGSDAVRLQYYTGMASNAEVAAKIDSSGKVTAAGYFRFNTLGYDIQLLGGVLSGEDLVLGAGWSGNISGASLRGEMSYFRNLDNFRDTTGYLLGSVGLDYTFGNSLWLQGEVLYSAFARERKIHSLYEVFNGNLNVKDLGFTPWSLFFSASYPVTPLLNTTLAGIYYPEWKGFFIGPSIDFSASGNIKISLISQYFSAELTNLQGLADRTNTFIGYLRFKWNF